MSGSGTLRGFTVRQRYSGANFGLPAAAWPVVPAAPPTPAAATQPPPQESCASPAVAPPAAMSAPGFAGVANPAASAVSGHSTLAQAALAVSSSPADPSRRCGWSAAEHAAAQHAAAAAAAVYSGVMPSRRAGPTLTYQPAMRLSPVSVPAPASARTAPGSGDRGAEQSGGVPYSEVLLSPDTTPGGSAQRGVDGGATPSDGSGRWRSPLSTATAAARAASAGGAPDPSEPAPHQAALQQRQWWTPHQAAAASAFRGSAAGFELPFSLITSSPALLPTEQAQRAQHASPSIDPLQARRMFVATHALSWLSRPSPAPVLSCTLPDSCDCSGQPVNACFSVSLCTTLCEGSRVRITGA